MLWLYIGADHLPFLPPLLEAFPQVRIVFNHLLAGTEAYVSALLWDFPAELTARTLPSGDVGVGLSLRWSAAFE